MLLFACGGSHAPTAPAASVTAVQVGVAGGGSTTLSPGDTRQLFANATLSDGTTIDVTNLATWQTSSANIVSVSPSGLVTAAAEGAVDLSATYKGTRGSLHADVKPTCAVSITPTSASYTAFGGAGTISVTVNAASCAWTSRSDAAWLPLAANGTGSGTFTYTLPANSTPDARRATLIVETTGGASATHTVTEDKPLGCSYVTQPEELTFSAAGGTGQFTVVTTPNDCRWTLINGLSQLGVSVLSGFSGTGNGVVRYSVQAHTRSVDADGYFEIAGLSGLNPNGRHHVILLKR